MYLDQLIAMYQTLDVSPIQGCAPDEIAHAEQLRGLRFPAAYREFLAWVGVESGDLFPELEDVNYLRMLDFLEEARSIATTFLREPLPDDAILICVYDMEQWTFLRASEGDDPPVYHFLFPIFTPAAVATDAPERYFFPGPRFTAWVAEAVNGSAAV